MNHVLIIHNNNNHYDELQHSFAHSGFLVTDASSFTESDSHNKAAIDIILVTIECVTKDIHQRVKAYAPCPVIVLDETPNTKTEEYIKGNGVHAYLPLPVNTNTLLDKVISLLDQKYQESTHKKTTNSTSLFDSIIGNSSPMKQLFNDVVKIANTDVTVLIRGESGSGKELIAKEIHNFSSRKKEALISINCAAIPESLIESELFGHEKGAFTGATTARDGLIAAADKGTLFLDEIGELPIEAQARLLRFLQEGEIRRLGAVRSSTVNVRILTATHRDLSAMVHQGLFREDLYYRLYVMELLLPPLRDRGTDINLIAKHLVKKIGAKHKRLNLIYTEAFNQAILQHNWPGNVRELENAIERAIILSDNDELDPVTLKLQSNHINTQSNTPSPLTMQGSTLDDYFMHFVLTNENTMTEIQIAQSLGISRKSLWERRNKLNIQKKSNK